MKLEIDKTYKLRQRDDSQADWFIFKPRVYVSSQAAWWGKSNTEHDLVVFEREMPHFDVVEVDEAQQPCCDCGARRAKTTHALWCSTLAHRGP